MNKLQKAADRFKIRLGASPSDTMASSFGATMGPLLGEDSSDLTSMVQPALERAVSQDLKGYSLPQQMRVAAFFQDIIRTEAKGYASDDVSNRTQPNYDQEESLSWVAQEVFAKARGQFDNEQRYGTEGRLV